MVFYIIGQGMESIESNRIERMQEYMLLNSRGSIDPNFDNINGHTMKSLSYMCRTQKTVNIEYRD